LVYAAAPALRAMITFTPPDMYGQKRWLPRQLRYYERDMMLLLREMADTAREIGGAIIIARRAAIR